MRPVFPSTNSSKRNSPQAGSKVWEGTSSALGPPSSRGRTRAARAAAELCNAPLAALALGRLLGALAHRPLAWSVGAGSAIADLARLHILVALPRARVVGLGPAHDACRLPLDAHLGGQRGGREAVEVVRAPTHGGRGRRGGGRPRWIGRRGRRRRWGRRRRRRGRGEVGLEAVGSEFGHVLLLTRGGARRALDVEAGLGDDLDVQVISGIRTRSGKGIGERAAALPHSGGDARKRTKAEGRAGGRRYGGAERDAGALQAASR